VKSTNYDSFLALADPTRREILMMLSRKTHSINSIADNFDISRPAVSKHIKVLSATGFITIEDKGRERLCMLNHQGFNEVMEWINYFEDYWNGKMKSLDKFLRQNKTPKKKK
jgi:DNA-binding transcriptional ArsR family regulator